MSSAPLSLDDALEALAGARGVLADWDGCLACGNRLTPAAKRFVAAYRGKLAIVSNNSTDLAEDFAGWIATSGVDILSERIVLAGVETIRQLAANAADKRIMLFASERVRGFARSLGLCLSKTGADQVALLRDTQFSYAKLARAVAAIEGGAALIVSNNDARHPGAEASIPETGALLAALKTAANLDDNDITIVGKPSPRLFELGADALGLDPHECVMIGDNPDTDGAGALALGMTFIDVGAASGLSVGDLIDAASATQARATLAR